VLRKFNAVVGKAVEGNRTPRRFARIGDVGGSVRSWTAILSLLADAELAENGIEQVLGGGLPDDFADGAHGYAQVHGH
jgi:hypothetical protein